MSTDHHLTPDQLAFYDENGYLLLRNHIPGNMLERLSDAAHSWIALGSGADPANPGDFQFAMRGGRSTMWRVDYVHDKGRAESLALLGSPQVLGVAESMCGPNFVPTYESLVFKQEGDGAAIACARLARHRGQRPAEDHLLRVPRRRGDPRTAPGTAPGSTSAFGWCRSAWAPTPRCSPSRRSSDGMCPRSSDLPCPTTSRPSCEWRTSPT